VYNIIGVIIDLFENAGLHSFTEYESKSVNNEQRS